MAKDFAGIWRRLAVKRLLVEFILLGGLLIALPQLSITSAYLPEELNHTVVELGKALLIAGILGWAIDEALKNDLVREAVAASLGYLLPERLKPELRWLYDQKVLAGQDFNVRLEHIPEKRCVIFHGTVKRRIENVSSEKTKVKLSGGIDDWFREHGSSEITACSWKRIEKDEKSSAAVPIKQQLSPVGISYDAGEQILKPEEIIEILMSYRLYLPDHGMEFLTYRYLIDRPTITVEAPATLKVFVTFSHRDRYDEEVRSDASVFSFTLERILLPHQDIKVYWHRADEVEERIQRHKLST